MTVFLHSSSTTSSVDTYLNFLSGHFDDTLPTTQSSEIRIFLSSTFKDYKEERNYLIENAHSELRQFCLNNYQKDLTFVDMRWGITDEAAKLQLSTEICLHEINMCQQESIGPNFLSFLSHRYGSRFLKTPIDVDEFNLIKEELKKCSDQQIVSLLDNCYELDDNYIKNKVYKLKDMEKLLDCLKIDKKEWAKQEKKLMNSMRNAADEIYKQGKFNKELRDEYFCSVTDLEVQSGILNANDSNLKTAVFFRNIENTGSGSSNSDSLKSFFESEKEMNDMLNLLRVEVEKKLADKNKFYFQVDWSTSNDFKQPYTVELKEYLRKFSESFKEIVMELVHSNLKNTKGTQLFDSELLHHANMCNRLTKNMIIRQHLIDKIKEYLGSHTNNKPYIIEGSSGSGKSTLLAYTAKYLKSKDDIVIIRFMGTTRNSANIKSLFNSIMKQIDHIMSYQKEGSTQVGNTDVEYKTDLVELKKQFIEKLTLLSATNQNKKIMLLLDSVDQLAKEDHTLLWFTNELPKNCKIIYSVLTNFNNITAELEQHGNFNESNHLKVNKLEINEGKHLLQTFLSAANRQLSDSQWKTVEECMLNTAELYPLHTKLLFDITSNWASSYTAPEEFSKCTSIKETIKYLFKNLESFYGETLFQRCIFYVTLFEYNGIAETELEDILSIDDDVLTSVFQHHHPPVRRFPIALWLNIKYALKDYLANKEADGVSVISWYHRAFIEASKEYYAELFEKSEHRDKAIMNVIDYFIEKWNSVRSDGRAGKMKEFEYKKEKLYSFKNKPNGKETEYVAYRNTKPQVITLMNDQSGSKPVKIYNKRKLNGLVDLVTLLNNDSTKSELLKDHVYYDYDFMFAKAELGQLDFVTDMHETILNLENVSDFEKNELVEISEIYKNNYAKIQHNPESLYLEVLSRLKTRPNRLESFIKKQGLSLQCSYIGNELIKSIFFVDKDSDIERFFSQAGGPYLIIESKTKQKSLKKLHVFDTMKKKTIGFLDLKMEGNNFQIILNDANQVNVLTLKDFNGHVYFSLGKKLCSMNFNSDISILKEFDEDVKDLILLNSNSLLVILQNSFIHILMDESIRSIRSEKKFEENNEIKFVQSTLDREIIYSDSFLRTNNSTAVIIGLSNQLIKLYKSDNSSNLVVPFCVIDSIKWNHYGFGKWINDHHTTWRDSILIDQSTFNQSRDHYIRFSVDDKHIFRIFDVNGQGHATIKREVKREKFEIATKYHGKIELENIHQNIALFKAYLDCTALFVYNIDNDSYTEHKFDGALRLYSLVSDHLYVIAQYGNIFRVFKWDNDEFKEIFYHEYSKTWFISYNEIRTEFKIKNDRLLRIEPNERQSLLEIDFLHQEDYAPTINELDVSRIYCVLDSTHLLVVAFRNEQVEVFVVSVVDQRILTSIVLEGGIEDLENNFVLNCNKNFFVYATKRESCLFVYKIKKRLEKYEISLVSKQKIKEEITKNWNFSSYQLQQCFFQEVNKTFHVRPMFINLEQNSIEVINIECIDDENGLTTIKQELSIVTLAHISIKKDKIDGLLTSLNNYLVLYDSESIYYFEIHTNSVIGKLNYKYETIYNIKGTDDLIFKSSNTIVVISQNDKKELDHKILKDQNVEFSIKVFDNYLLVYVWPNSVLEVYNLNKTVNGYLDQQLFKISISLNDSCLSTNGKYLICQTTKHQLMVYDLERKNLVSNVPVNDDFFHLICSDKYVSFLLNHKLLSFEIIH